MVGGDAEGGGEGLFWFGFGYSVDGSSSREQQQRGGGGCFFCFSVCLSGRVVVPCVCREGRCPQAWAALRFARAHGVTTHVEMLRLQASKKLGNEHKLALKAPLHHR